VPVVISSHFRHEAPPLIKKTPEILAAKVGTIYREGCSVILQKRPLPRHLRICFWISRHILVPLSNKHQAAWTFLCPMSRDVQLTSQFESFFFPYLWIRGVSLSSIHYKQTRRVYVNKGPQYIRL